jgi:hypothetical protein
LERVALNALANQVWACCMIFAASPMNLSSSSGEADPP